MALQSSRASLLCSQGILRALVIRMAEDLAAGLGNAWCRRMLD